MNKTSTSIPPNLNGNQNAADTLPLNRFADIRQVGGEDDFTTLGAEHIVRDGKEAVSASNRDTRPKSPVQQ